MNMELVNEKFKVIIKLDNTSYRKESSDNVINYDIVINPSENKQSDFDRTFCIEVKTSEKLYRIALVGSCYSIERHCAVLENNILTVLQNEYISQIDLTNGSLVNRIHIGNTIYFELYRLIDKYIIFGELEILCFNERFEQEWCFSGRDIFTKFEIDGDIIKLWDWEKYYYEINLKGELINDSN